jgi:Uma2 family endonuclease
MFQPSERLELIGGEVIEKLSPQRSAHSTVIGLVEDEIRPFLAPNTHLRVQLPLSLGPASDPEPDLAVVAGRRRQYEDNHPSSALIVVEVADSTVRFDRTTKASLYASAGIPEYVVVNIPNRCLEVHLSPISDPLGEFGHTYAVHHRLSEDEIFESIALTDIRLAVRDILPIKQNPTE